MGRPVSWKRYRSIPACAGETAPRRFGGRWSMVYPRVCGGNHGGSAKITKYRGLSPRVRGKRGQRFDAARERGSIPACAGETSPEFSGRARRRVYPRVCGGNWRDEAPVTRVRGLSPRVRGKLSAFPLSGRNRRSIPACAGETHCPAGIGLPCAVYPRVCGGNATPIAIALNDNGLSPRVRGKRCGNSYPSAGRGSIPACAGETEFPLSTLSRGKVYPRVCGGNACWCG